MIQHLEISIIAITTIENVSQSWNFDIKPCRRQNLRKNQVSYLKFRRNLRSFWNNSLSLSLSARINFEKFRDDHPSPQQARPTKSKKDKRLLLLRFSPATREGNSLPRNWISPTKSAVVPRKLPLVVVPIPWLTRVGDVARYRRRFFETIRRALSSRDWGLRFSRAISAPANVKLRTVPAHVPLPTVT